MPEEDLPIVDISPACSLSDKEEGEDREDEDHDEGLQEAHGLECAVIEGAVVLFDELVERDVVFDPALDPALSHRLSLEMDNSGAGEKDDAGRAKTMFNVQRSVFNVK